MKLMRNYYSKLIDILAIGVLTLQLGLKKLFDYEKRSRQAARSLQAQTCNLTCLKERWELDVSAHHSGRFLALRHCVETMLGHDKPRCHQNPVACDAVIGL